MGTEVALSVVMSRRLGFAIAFVALCGTTRAWAEPEASPAASTNGTAATGYRLQVLAVDAAGAGLLFLAGALEGEDGRDTTASDTLRLMGGGTFLFGGPIVHVSHGANGRGAASLALRVALPVIGGLIGKSMADCPNGQLLCGFDESLGGMLVGAVAASVVDVSVLAGAPAAESPAPPRPGFVVAPRLVATPNVAMLGVGGQF
jgi:hypothetical protein